MAENRFRGSLLGSSLQKPKSKSNHRYFKSDLENSPPVDPNIRASVPRPEEFHFVKQSLSPSKNQATISNSPHEVSASQRGITVDKICHEVEETSNPHVKVVVRIRPTKEQPRTARIVANDSLSVRGRQFTFDSVLDSNLSQEGVFQQIGVPLVRNVLSGYNTCVVSYGQTGSGKTYTMWGPPRELLEDPSPKGGQGLAPRIFQLLFSEIQREKQNPGGKEVNYQCRCSFHEIYNGQITDLIDQTQRNLEIKEDLKIGTYVENLTEEYVNSYEDVAQILVKGLSSRKVGATSTNPKSSRSHIIFSFIIESWCKGSSSRCFNTTRTSRINLVDLAGAESNTLNDAGKQYVQEEKYLKKSLSQLGRVVNTLSMKVHNGVSEGNIHKLSCLTHLLQEALGGNTKLTVICNISPSNKNMKKMVSTLRFGERVKTVGNKPVINEISEEDVNDLSDQIRMLKEELIRAKSDDYHSVGSKSDYFGARSARESLNQLRVSLNRSLMLPKINKEEEEVVVDEDDVMELRQQIRELNDSFNNNLTEKSVIRDSVSSSFVTATCDTELMEDEDICSGKYGDLAITSEPPIQSESPKIKNKLRKSVVLSSSLHRSNIFLDPTDSLAASLRRGLEIIDSQMNSASNSSSVSLSFENSTTQTSKETNKAATLVCHTCLQKQDGGKCQDLETVMKKQEELENLCVEQAAKIEQLTLLLEQYKNQSEDKTAGDQYTKNENKLMSCNVVEDHQHEVVNEKYDVKQVHEDSRKESFEVSEGEALLGEIESLKNQPNRPSDKGVDFKRITEEGVEKERVKWREIESEWISLTDGLRVDIETQRMRAEKAEARLKMEKMTSEELDDALGRAIHGHARFVEHYTELQEKYDDLAGKHKAMSVLVTDLKNTMVKMGGKGRCGSRFAKSLCAELSALRVEKERERDLLKKENVSLKIQLRNTAEAVHAAGALLVRLREAEHLASDAEEKLARVEEEKEVVKKKMEKLKRKHKMEIITRKQCLEESSLDQNI